MRTLAKYLMVAGMPGIGEYIEARVERIPDGCWVWTGQVKAHGYGLVKFRQTEVSAHRLVYVIERGEFDPALELDHLCRNTKCVNPDHLEPVTPRVNKLRGTGFAARNASKFACKRGHMLAGDNALIERLPHGHARRCRECTLELQRQRRRRLKAEASNGFPR